MKKLQFAILLSLLCASISQITAQTNDSLRIAPAQVRNVYVGLKQGEEAKKRLAECTEIANSLNDIIQQQNDSLQAAGTRILSLNDRITQEQANLLNKAVEVQKLKDRKTPWYLHPVTYSILGFISGILIAK